MIRSRLQKLADTIAADIGPFGYRAFSDSAPVMESNSPARPASAGAANTPAAFETGFLALSRRNLYRSAAAARRTGRIALRHLHRLYRRLPDWRHRRPLPGRRPALHFPPEHRTRRPDPEELRPCSAIASTAATTASFAARGIVSRRSATRNSRRATSWMRPRCWNSLHGPNSSSTTAWRATRSAASATSAGCAISPWRSATGRRRQGRGRSPGQRLDHPSAVVREHVAWVLARLSLQGSANSDLVL